jgi:hypothetical protein
MILDGPFTQFDVVDSLYELHVSSKPLRVTYKRLKGGYIIKTEEEKFLAADSSLTVKGHTRKPLPFDSRPSVYLRLNSLRSIPFKVTFTIQDDLISFARNPKARCTDTREKPPTPMWLEEPSHTDLQEHV